MELIERQGLLPVQHAQWVTSMNKNLKSVNKFQRLTFLCTGFVLDYMKTPIFYKLLFFHYFLAIQFSETCSLTRITA
jgi:hypothetical protein